MLLIMLRLQLDAQIAAYPTLRAYVRRLAAACEETVPRPPPVRQEGWQREDTSRCGDMHPAFRPRLSSESTSPHLTSRRAMVPST